MKNPTSKLNALAAAGLFVGLTAAAPTPADATPLDDFNAGTLVANFLFDEPNGTALTGVVSTVNPAAQFDDDADLAGAATNGLGQFDASGKNNTDFASNYVDIDAITTGTVYGLFEVSWDFDVNVFDPAQDEEFRLSLITFDPRSTFVTGETFFTRTSATQVELVGNAVGTGSADTPAALFGSAGSLLTILEADLDNSTLTLSYSSDGGASFTTLAPGTLDPTRGVESLRLVLNEDFSNDILLIERFALSVVPEPATTATLLVVAAGLLRRRPREQAS